MQWRYWLCVLALTLLAFACLFDRSGQLRLEFDPTTDSLMDSASVKKEADSEILALFRKKSAWDVEAVLVLADLLSEIDDLPGVNSIESPVTARLPQITGEDIFIKTLEQRIRESGPEAGEAWIRWTFDEPLLKGRLVNVSKNDVGARLRLTWDSLDQKNKLLDTILTLTDRFDSDRQDIEIFLTGAPVVDRDVSNIMVSDLGKVLMLSTLIVMAVLVLVFTHIIATVLTLFTIVLALIWSLAGMVLLGIPINLVTAIVPTLIVGLTVAYAMHAIFGNMHIRDEQESWRWLVGPFAATGVTTIAALLALCLQSMPAIRQFGLAGAVGVASAIAAIVLVLCLAGRPWLYRVSTRDWLAGLFAVTARYAFNFVQRRRKWIIAGALLVFLLSVFFGTKVVPGASYMSDMPAQHPTRINFEAINKSLGGGNGFRIIIRGAGEDSVILPGVLTAAESLQTWLDEQPEIGQTTSLVDYVKRLNQIFHYGHDDAFVIPDNFFITKQLLAIASTSEVERYTNLDSSMLVIQVQTPLDETEGLTHLIKRLEKRLEQFPEGLAVELQGEAVTMVRAIEQLTTGQVKSLGLAVLAIYLVISLLFASFRIGVKAMLPNLIPIAVFYGLIGLAGINLSPTMALISCLVVGIAVDDTLFYLVRFNHAARACANESRGTERALRETIQPVTLTTIILCLCFLTLGTGQFESQATFGILAATTLLVAWACDLTLTPAIGLKSSIVTLWEVLNVDLGSNPRETIPLMRGMTTGQARLFALLTQLQTIQAGSHFISEGDEGQDMYVILEGEARVWVKRDNQEIEIVRFSRGALIGEMSTFVKHRTANVTAITDMRVLVFDPARLDRIRRWHPRIAGLVYQNLNQIQAERLEKTTLELEELRTRNS